MSVNRDLRLPDAGNRNVYWRALQLADFYLLEARELEPEGPALYPRQQVLLQHAQSWAAVAAATAWMRHAEGTPMGKGT